MFRDGNFHTTIGSSTGSLDLYGWGKTADQALDDLETKCEQYITEIERNLNIELVP